MSHHSRRLAPLAAAIALSSGFTSTAGLAQEMVIEEVIVTAQKRESNLQETAIAISAIGADMFDEMNIRNSSDYEAIVPSLSVRDAPARLFIRGIGRVTNSLGTEPGVAVYLDQAYTAEITVLSRATSLTTERVEVLRGPQGTLFGRNATGGAVSITSKRPTQEPEHHVRAKAGNYGLFNWGASSSGPVTDGLGYRVYAYGNSRDGYVDNAGGKDIWDQDHDGLGAQLSWDASDSLNVWLSYAKDETDDISSGVNFGGWLISPYNTTAISQDRFLLSESYQWSRENPATRDPYEVDLNDPLHTRNDNNNKFTAQVAWDLDALTVKYIGSYFEGDYSALNGDLGYTSNPDNRVVESAEQNTETYSHEIQFLSAGDGALQWVGGLYYFNEDKQQPYSIASLVANYLDNTVPLGSFNAALVQPNPGRLQYWQNAELQSESYAAYADANYTFNPQWKLTAGLRYSYDEKQGKERQLVVTDPLVYGLDYRNLPPSFGFPQNCCGWLTTSPAVANRELDDDWDNVSGRVVLDYTPDDDTLLYASISNGYKSGGFRLGSLQPTPSFDEEKVLSYELGYKGTFAEVFQLNGAVYFYDYEDMQVLVPYLNAQNLPVEEVINAKKAEVKGLELEAIWLASESLTLMANYSYTDGEYTDFCCAVDTIGDPTRTPQDLSGNSLTQSPENKLFLNAAYAWRTQTSGEFVLSGSYSWVDERQYDVFGTDATLADDYYRVDAMLSWYSPSSKLSVILSGRNLTEEETWSSLQRLNAFGALNGFPNEPRTYGLEVQYDF